MISKFALLSSLLLVSATLASPSSQLAARLARRRVNRQSRPMVHVESSVGVVSHIDYDPAWAGAAWNKDNGTFTTVTGTFTVPTLSGRDGSSSAWVGIDGDSCQSGILQTGIDFTLSDGKVLYDPWYEWYPDESYDFSDITISAGDVIKTTVVAFSKTSGKAIIENLTTGKIVTKHLRSTAALCRQDAEWIVEDYSDDDNETVPFVNFGSVTFTNATAWGRDGIVYTPSGATIIDIKQHHKILTSVTVSGDTVTIKYV